MSSILRVDSIQTAAGGSATASGLGIGGVGKIGQWSMSIKQIHLIVHQVLM